MTGQEPDQDPAASRPGVQAPPVTGHDRVDPVLDALQGLDEQPVAEHHDRLARAHELLHAVLSDESEASANQGGA